MTNHDFTAVTSDDVKHVLICYMKFIKAKITRSTLKHNRHLYRNKLKFLHMPELKIPSTLRHTARHLNRIITNNCCLTSNDDHG